MISIITVLLALLLTIIIIFLHNFVWRSTSQTRSRSMAPEPKGAWPIIGHLHLLGGENQLVHHLLGSMADTYGPAFTIRLGLRRALIVSSWEVAKDCFTGTNDKVFATRPNSTGAKIMGYDTGMFGFAPYGPYWREIRKIATLELLSNRRLEMLKEIRNSEIKLSIKGLYENWMKKGGESPVFMEMKRWFGDLSFNITVRMIAGKRYAGENCDCDGEESQRCQKAMADFMQLLGMFVLSDAIPFLGFLDLHGFEKKMRKTGRDIDLVLGKWVEEHRNRKTNISGSNSGENRDFIDVMLSILNNEKEVFSRDADTIIKSTCLSLVLGGHETTSVTLSWALSLLINNPRVLQKAQAELDHHIGNDRQVEESDVRNLVYLHAIVKEVMRLHPPGQLLPPREAMEDCTVAGFYIPKGTQLMVNLWKLHRDPRIWSDPLEFKPERFLCGYEHADVDVRGQSFELLPFGSGRRICPGISMALQVLHLTLARLLHGFDMSTPANEPIDMTEASGLTTPKATPLEVLLNPRLPLEVYADSEN